MGKTTKINSSTSDGNYKKILQAMLDSYKNPVWIFDESGVALANEPAKALEKQGFSIGQMTADMSVGELKVLNFQDRNISIKKSEIKNSGNVLLHEVSFESPSTARLRSSTAKLRATFTS